MKEKIRTYINFSIKSGECAIGTDNILKLRRAELIVVSSELSKNAQNKIKNKSIAKVLTIDDVLPSGVLALAITNANLAGAIISQMEN